MFLLTNKQLPDQDEPGELDRIFKVTKTIQNGFCSISEEIFDIFSPNLIHRCTIARRRPSSNWVTKFSRSRRSFVRFQLNILRHIILASANSGEGLNVGKSKTKFWPGDLDLILKVYKSCFSKSFPHNISRIFGIASRNSAQGFFWERARPKFKLVWSQR